jgi:hypothetical protein
MRFIRKDPSRLRTTEAIRKVSRPTSGKLTTKRAGGRPMRTAGKCGNGPERCTFRTHSYSAYRTPATCWRCTCCVISEPLAREGPFGALYSGYLTESSFTPAFTETAYANQLLRLCCLLPLSRQYADVVEVSPDVASRVLAKLAAFWVGVATALAGCRVSLTPAAY